MGRSPTRWKNLPKGMRARVRGEKIYYFLDLGGKPRKEVPLGTDYVNAVQKWAQLNARSPVAVQQPTFVDLCREYRIHVIPTKSRQTQKDNEKELEWLERFFSDPPAPLDQVKPVHVRQYMDWRVAQARASRLARSPTDPVPVNFGGVRANREKALLSHMWNYARERGLTDASNPCVGVRTFKEAGRDVTVGRQTFENVLAKADVPTQHVLRLADLIAQRPADVLRVSEDHVVDGILHVVQGKVKTKLRIEVVGDLADLVQELRDFKDRSGAACRALLVTETGQPMTASTLRSRFDRARKLAGVPKQDFQIRDLRATGATFTDEVAGIRAAQALLGHTTEAMTTTYVRHKVGRKVSPVQRGLRK